MELLLSGARHFGTVFRRYRQRMLGRFEKATESR